MTSTTVRPAPTAVPAAAPRRARRAAIVGTAVLAGLLPTVWGLGSLVELATGTQTDHRFHQVTGQGLVLSALWLTPVLLLARAGLRGRRPSAAVGLHHLVLMTAGVGAGLLGPGGGGLAVGVFAAVTGSLLWLALAQRPLLSGARLDVVLAPLALLTTALVLPFVASELSLQRDMLDEHAEMAHYFDMAWVCLTLAGMAVVAALSAASRRLAVPAGAGLALVGVSRFLFTDDVTWSVLAVLLGLAGAVAGARRSAA